MNLLEEIIDEHFLSSDKEELLLLFNKYDIQNIISKSALQLRNQLQSALVSNNGVPLTAITTTSSNFLITVNNQIVKIPNPEEKLQVQQAIAQIGLRILLSIIKLFPEEATDIFDSVKQSLEITSEIFGYNYKDIDDLLMFDEFTELTKTLTGIKFANEIQKVKTKNVDSLIWTKKVPLGYLTTELKKRKWIKSQNEFSKLFNNPSAKLKVHWDIKFKYELAHLLLRLKDEDFIRPRKGFFKVAEKYIVDFSEHELTKNSLKKISSKISNEPSEYINIIKKVDEILKVIT